MPFPAYQQPQADHAIIEENERIENKITFTQDEIRVMRECNVESFYYRCIPFGVLFSGLAYIGMKNGYLMKSPRYGYAPKMAIGAFLGYFMGKFSYQNVCAEKIMKLENSPLADAIKRRKGKGGFKESSLLESGYPMDSPSTAQERDLTLFDQRSPDLSEHSEGSEGYRQVTESLSPYSSDDEMKAPSGPLMSYEELRRANREEYGNKMIEKYKKSPSHSTDFFGGDDLPSSRPTEPSRPFVDSRKSKQNKYGDQWDE